MLKKLFCIAFLLTLGKAFSQVSYFFSLNAKQNIAFTKTYYENNQISNKIEFEDLMIKHRNTLFKNLYKLGIGLGINYNKHNLLINLQHNTFYSEKEFFYKINHSDYRFNKSAVGPITRTFFLQHDYYLIKKPKKTNLFFSSIASLQFNLSRNNQLTFTNVEDSIFSGNNIISYGYYRLPTYKTQHLGIGAGLGSDIYIKKMYILSLYANFVYFKSNLAEFLHTLTIKSPTEVNTYQFSTKILNTSVYFGITRRFQIIPFKPIKSLPIVQFFQERINDDSTSYQMGAYADGKTLIFKTIDNFKRIISEKNIYKHEILFNSLEKLHYDNYFSKEQNPNDKMDSLLGRLLNADGAIQIENYVYKIDLTSNKVFVLEARHKNTDYKDLITGNLSNKRIQVFSTNDDVLYALYENNKNCKTLDLFELKTEKNTQTICNDTLSFDCGINYFKAGIFFRLNAETHIYQTNNATFESFLEIDTIQLTENPCKKGNIIRYDKNHNFQSDTSLNSNQNFVIYQGTRGLNKSYIKIRTKIVSKDCKDNILIMHSPWLELNRE